MRRISALPLALALSLTLAACGGDDDSGGGGGGGAAAAGNVTIQNFTFTPAEITIPAGTTVTWTNEDDFAHTVKPSDDLFPASPDIDAANPFRHTYDTAGTYPYICGIHNSMTGTVVVT